MKTRFNLTFLIVLLSITAYISVGQCPLKINYDAAGNRVYRGNACDPDCSLLVTNTSDDGPGSFRKAVTCAAEGDTILFSPALVGQYISLTSGAVYVNKSIHILQGSSSIIRLRADGVGPVLEYISGQSQIRYSYLYGSLEPHKEGRALINRADLTLQDVHLYDTENLIGSGSTVTNYGNLSINGSTKVIVLSSF